VVVFCVAFDKISKVVNDNDLLIK